MKLVFISRRKIQIVIGAFWFLDGCLQLQPKMFTSKFITQVVQPAQVGQPFYIYDPIHFGIKLFLTHPAVFNSLIVLVQMTIGLLILYKPSAKVGLWLSVAYGLFVWVMGEAAAGMFSGHSSLIVGLPGAALLYSLISLGVLSKGQDDQKPADSWLAFIWALVWSVGAMFELLPAQNSMSMLKSMITANVSGAPRWLAYVDKHAASLLNHFGASTSMNMGGSSGYLYILVLALVMLAIGLGVFLGKNLRLATILLGIILSLIFWVVGQSLGDYYTGVMTDLQTAPLIILLAVAIIGQPDLKLKLNKVYLKLEKIVT